MALKQVVEELTMPESEFRGHRHVLSRYPKGAELKSSLSELSRALRHYLQRRGELFLQEQGAF